MKLMSVYGKEIVVRMSTEEIEMTLNNCNIDTLEFELSSDNSTMYLYGFNGLTITTTDDRIYQIETSETIDELESFVRDNFDSYVIKKSVESSSITVNFNEYYSMEFTFQG